MSIVDFLGGKAYVESIRTFIDSAYSNFIHMKDREMKSGFNTIRVPTIYRGVNTDFEIRMLNNVNQDIRKSPSEPDDSPGMDYVSMRKSSKACGGTIINPENPGTSSIDLGSTPSKPADGHTPAWVNVKQFRIQVTAGQTTFDDSDVTVQAWYSVVQRSDIPWWYRNSDADALLASNAPSNPTINTGNFSLTYNSDTKYSNLFSGISNTITVGNVGTYLIWVRVRITSKQSNTYNEGVSFALYKYDNRTPTCAMTRFDDLGANPAPNSNIEYKLTSTGALRMYDRFKTWDGTAGTEWTYGTQLSRVSNQSVNVKFNATAENTTYTPRARIRGINGVWSAIKSCDTVHTTFLDPKPPHVKIHFNKGEATFQYTIIDLRDSLIDFTAGGNTACQFRLYNGSSWSTVYSATNSSITTPFPSGKSRLYYTSPTKYAIGQLTSLRWGVRYVNKDGITTNNVESNTSVVIDKLLAVQPTDNFETGNPVYMRIPEEVSDRKQLGLNLNEIHLYKRNYKDSSTWTSLPWVFPKPLYKVFLSVSEEIPSGGNIEYALSFDDGNTWYPINPLDRPEMSDLSNVLTINAGLSKEQKENSGKPIESYVDMAFNPYNAIVRGTIYRGDNEYITPITHSYKVMAISRDILEKST